jgi:hypothetical protein
MCQDIVDNQALLGLVDPVGIEFELAEEVAVFGQNPDVATGDPTK